MVKTKEIYNLYCVMIIESLRLEKTTKIIKSSHQPITTIPAKPYPEVP